MNNCSYLSRVLSKKMSFFYKYFEIAIWSNVNQTLGSALGMLRVETSSAYNFCYETFCSDYMKKMLIKMITLILLPPSSLKNDQMQCQAYAAYTIVFIALHAMLF